MTEMAEHRTRETPRTDGGRARVISMAQVNGFLESMALRGCSPQTVKSYRRNLTLFFRDLPPGKTVEAGTLAGWRDSLLREGYMPRTVNNRISSVNSFLGYLGLREYQDPEQLKLPEDEVQPELTRNEYLRLLSAARALGKERTYFIVKAFTVLGLPVQELPRLTAEAVEEGRVSCPGRLILIPPSLRDELTGYIRREGIRSGPVFVTKNGRPLNRTAVTAYIQQLAADARVPPEKCNPRCLRKLHLATRESVEQSVSMLVDQALDRLLEQEQALIGWEDAAWP